MIDFLCEYSILNFVVMRIQTILHLIPDPVFKIPDPGPA